MKKPNLSAKRIAVDKTNASLIVIVSITAFIVVFCLVASKALFDQLSYQSRVINKKEATLTQVEKNFEEVSKLDIAYQEFIGGTTNAIGGDPNGKGDKDGDNSKIILDALPSKYDFPALTSSIDKLVSNGGYQLTSIDGTDDEINQADNQVSINPQPEEMPFRLEADIASTKGKNFLQLFERSIRPIHIESLVITGQERKLKIEVSAKTYFKPEKRLNITEKTVK